jgi:hypothetical protein
MNAIFKHQSIGIKYQNGANIIAQAELAAGTSAVVPAGQERRLKAVKRRSYAATRCAAMI